MSISHGAILAGGICFILSGFFVLSGFALLVEPRFPDGSGWTGIAFGTLFVVGAFRNVTPAVQKVANLNNMLLPLWKIVLGGVLIGYPPG